MRVRSLLSPPEVEQGHAEILRQLVLLVLCGRLAAGFKFFHRVFGKTQGGGEGGAAQVPLGAEGLDPLGQCDHRNDLLCKG